MNTAYIFRIGPLLFILNIQSSTLGYGYPRIFVSFPDNSYLNFDLTLGAVFEMSEADWMSWIDDELIKLDNIEDIRQLAAESGINWDNFEKLVFELYENNK